MPHRFLTGIKLHASAAVIWILWSLVYRLSWQIGKKHQGLVDRLYTIETDGREAEQLHKLVIQRLTNILGDGPGA